MGSVPSSGTRTNGARTTSGNFITQAKTPVAATMPSKSQPIQRATCAGGCAGKSDDGWSSEWSS